MMTTAFMTDMYEVTMLQSALQDGLAHKKATFELFARKLPSGRRYGVVAGVERAIQAVQDFRFTKQQLAFLSSLPVIEQETVDYLKDFKFTGTITGYADGDVYFPYSPILTVEATFGQAVLLETVLLSILNHDSAVASAAARMVQAAEGIPIIEMGSRRTHEESAVAAARSAYMVGFTATSNLEAGLRYGIPVTGTSAHAFSLAHEYEKEAFRQQVAALGENTTLLVDTFDIPQGIRNAVEVAGPGLGGIRIDSGDLHDETVAARELLDSLNAVDTKIVLSSDIDEFAISEMVDRGTPVDGIGAGTRVVTGSGHPTAGMVYKLVAIESHDGSMRPVAKKASGKVSVGGKKVPYRFFEDGVMTGEFYVIGEDFIPRGAFPLHSTYIEDGMVHDSLSLEDIRRLHQSSMNALPAEAKLIGAGDPAFIVEQQEGGAVLDTAENPDEFASVSDLTENSFREIINILNFAKSVRLDPGVSYVEKIQGLKVRVSKDTDGQATATLLLPVTEQNPNQVKTGEIA